MKYLIVRNKTACLAFSPLLLLCVFLTACKKESRYQEKAKPEVTIHAGEARFQADVIHLYKDTVYVLVTPLTRNAGQVLQIDAGTLIKVNDKISITINPGATINAKGTATDPIVFTSAAFEGGAGVGGGGSAESHYWYGISVNGNALSSQPASSGTLQYVRIEFAGGDENQLGLPSLLLKNIVKGTVIENVMVSYSYSTSSFEFSGGDCNAANLVSYASNRSDFHIREGYKGMLQNLLAYRHPYFPVSMGPDFSGLLIEGTETFPVISNVSVIGPDLQTGTSFYYKAPFDRRAALLTSGGAKFRIRNAVLLGFPRGGWYLADKATAIPYNNGESEFTYSIVHSNDSARAFYLPSAAYPPITASDFKNYALQPSFGNELFLTSAAFILTDPFNYDTDLNAFPKTGSPILSGAQFDGVFNDPFFKKVAWRGALGAENWLQGWTNFKPLQTNYNN